MVVRFSAVPGSLEPPRLKIERAKKHIRDLEVAVKRFLDSNPYGLVPNEDTKAGKQPPRVSVREDPPDELSLIAGDAIHNLRSALDLLVWQLVLANGSTPHDRTGFPMFRSKEAFEAGDMRPIVGVSSTAEEAIKALKPYPGGDDTLWSLHRLDIADKHRFLLIVGLALRSVTMLMAFPGATEGIGLQIDLNQKEDKFFPLKDGAELFPEFFDALALTPLPIQPDFQLAFDVAFGEGAVVKGEPLVPTLFQIADYVEGIVESFASEFV